MRLGTVDTTGTFVHSKGPMAVEAIAAVAQLVECVLGKDEVMGSSPISSSVDCRSCLVASYVNDADVNVVFNRPD